jgi:hypothetical protein
MDNGAGTGLELGVGTGDNSMVGPVHFVLPATTSARRANEANLALGCAYCCQPFPHIRNGT